MHIYDLILFTVSIFIFFLRKLVSLGFWQLFPRPPRHHDAMCPEVQVQRGFDSEPFPALVANEGPF